MECLDAAALEQLAQGTLDGPLRNNAFEHLTTCADCRAIYATVRARASEIALGATEQPITAEIKPAALAATAATTAPSKMTADVSLMLKSGTRQIGKKLGKYTLVERIGAGAMGVVYRADDPGLNRRVALKLLHRPDAALTDRLIREARSMAQVNHPNVVQVYDADVSDGSTYIAMELVPGQSLRSWQDGKRTIPEIIEKYLAAGRGLAAAHAAGIIHRDFKPDNVLVGGDGRVRVTDFGLASARAAEESEGQPPGAVHDELTQSGVVLGTPAYMSPEQFTGGNLDPRTDQFNYCVALYEALYGHRPFEGKTFHDLGDNVCDGKIKPAPRDTRVSRSLRRILLRGLSVRPGDRYPTMDELLDDLGLDRARRWRIAAIAAMVIAGALALAIAADFFVRERVSHTNNKFFSATSKQIQKAFRLLTDQFETNGNQMYALFALREVTNYRDQADFGLRSEEGDAEERRHIHDLLVSTDWRYFEQRGNPQAVASEPDEDDDSELDDDDPSGVNEPQDTGVLIGVTDYKGRLLYTNAQRTIMFNEPLKIDWFKAARAAQAETGQMTMVLQPTADPQLLASGLIGKPSFQLAFLHMRTLFIGNDKEPASTVIQSIDATMLANRIRLDSSMRLSIVDNDFNNNGRVRYSVPEELIAAARGHEDVVEVEYRGSPYQVMTRPLVTRDGKQIGTVVMAQRLSDILSGFFPHARLVFVTAAVLALLTSLATWLQVRRLAR